MRVTVSSVLVASVMFAGCNQSEATTPRNALAHPAGGASAPAVAPAPTMSRADIPRAAEPARMAEPAPEAEATHQITIPAGTQLTVTLDTPVGSDTSRVEEAVTAHLAHPIRVQGRTVLAAGSRVTGVVTDATRSAKVKGRAHVAIRFDSLTPHGDDQRYAIRTASVSRTAEATRQQDALKIGAPAAGGAIIGALLGGKKGALVGTAVGGGAGTAAVLSTRGHEVHLRRGASLTLKLAAPLAIKVRG
jgi:hypothetical protein